MAPIPSRSRPNLSRRQFIRRSSLLSLSPLALSPLALLSAGCRSSQSADTSASGVVRTTLGPVGGLERDGVRIFQGIPYGAPTGGANRFGPPQPREPWTDVLEATAYGASAPQRGSVLTEGEFNGSEDCLFLNVWTPATGDGGDRPVMVWLHGGGFSSGSGSSLVYDGANLCNGGDVVVVTLNHRLNVFGQTYLAGIGGEEFHASGCAGILDIVAALEWIRDNIAEFGGNPDNVTIFGESGGGRKVSVLLTMPAAAGLFHRAIIQSGAVLQIPETDDATRSAELLLAELDLTDPAGLRNVPADALLQASSRALEAFEPRVPIVGTTVYTPVLDGQHLLRHPFEPDATEVSADVPVMAGWTRTEETLWYRGDSAVRDLDGSGLAERVEERLGDQARRNGTSVESVIDAYRATHPDASPWDLYMLVCTDHPRGVYPREVARRKSTRGAAPTFVYRFDWELSPEMRAPHAIEIPFAFDNVGSFDIRLFEIPATEESLGLADRVSAAWMAFARNGDPNTEALPEWAPYSEERRATMLFNTESEVVDDPEPETRVAMEKVLGLG